MWQLENRTPFAAERTWVRDRDGAEIWLVAVKCTFDIKPDGRTEVAAEQPPVVMASEYQDPSKPAQSSLKYDMDLVRTKTTTDVLVLGHAYAPRGEPVEEMNISVQIGPVQKRLHITGDRVWQGRTPSRPVPFVKMPLVYERAYGGVDPESKDTPAPQWDDRNPVGTGYALSRDRIEGLKLPNIEYPDQLVRKWNDRPAPAGFGPICGHWKSRVSLAGTYDDRWQQERFPLLPLDFDDRYFQSAPLDQQAPEFFSGRETVTLQNLTPNGRLQFQLPHVRLGFETFFNAGERHIHEWLKSAHDYHRSGSLKSLGGVAHSLALSSEGLQTYKDENHSEESRVVRTWAQRNRRRGRLTVDNMSLQIVGMGASTPVGRTAWVSAAAVRAGICGFSEHPYMIDTAGEPMRIARAPWLDMAVQGPERYLALLIPAVEEALAPVHKRLKSVPFKIGCTLGLPPVRPGRPEALGQVLLEEIATQFQGVFTHRQVFEVGHAAGHLAMNKAIELCERRTLDLCLVAAVDSYLEPETLEWLEANDQFHGAGPQNNAWGFIPGEAAGAVLVARHDIATRLGCEVFGELLSVGIGQETKLIKTDSVCIGEGLTQAFRVALQGLAGGHQIHNVFCDLNGETYRADEYGFTALRTKERFRAATDFVAPADCWGDIGAASAPLHTILGLICHRKRYGAGPLSMVWASSESGERGAAVIRAAELGKV